MICGALGPSDSLSTNACFGCLELTLVRVHPLFSLAPYFETTNSSVLDQRPDS